MKKLFLALMAVAAIAIVGCEGRHYVDDPNAPENYDRGHSTPNSNDSNGANQSSKKAPMRMYLTVTSTETDGE